MAGLLTRPLNLRPSRQLKGGQWQGIAIQLKIGLTVAGTVSE